MPTISHYLPNTAGRPGRIAQMVERPLRMREVWGSIPHVSTLMPRPNYSYAHDPTTRPW